MKNNSFYVWWDIFLNEKFALPYSDMSENLLATLKKEGMTPVIQATP